MNSIKNDVCILIKLYFISFAIIILFTFLSFENLINLFKNLIELISFKIKRHFYPQVNE